MSDPAVEAANRAWMGHTHPLAQDIAEQGAREALAPIRELHRKIHPIFSWAEGGLRFEEPCQECGGRAGAHPCGCWGERDVEYHCRECRDSKGRALQWPCPTARLIYREDEL